MVGLARPHSSTPSNTLSDIKDRSVATFKSFWPVISKKPWTANATLHADVKLAAAAAAARNQRDLRSEPTVASIYRSPQVPVLDPAELVLEEIRRSTQPKAAVAVPEELEQHPPLHLNSYARHRMIFLSYEKLDEKKRSLREQLLIANLIIHLQENELN
ncbi:hypothetical protein BCR33DRAFT_761771 [Rhizoclosmatium globosum]|uniref:Uncharacterized protein n=1 Tax=Rhizoclosmatium globosum TaxID=329046 RepID=A0A1Y2D0C3_9FUNG|nr:hypothetical protein BCR33DRAFT_761771 [Rhizoclosmatium globosum]|eukprot:ORY52647.1 hypothetical protein BCR33DRAFT_761771 [Rhizoclosmatium globosum]